MPARTPGSTLPNRPDNARDRRFHRLTVAGVVRETADAASLVLDIPGHLRDEFAYRAGQFVTLRVRLDGEDHYRSYSMSSSPVLDEPFTVTVKKVPGGRVSTWVVDTLAAGDGVEVSVPTGAFTLSGEQRDVVALGGGSGITPLLSLATTALTAGRTVRLLHANRHAGSVIFAARLRELADRHPGRFDVVHHMDDVAGLVTEPLLREFADPGAEHFLCGPDAFMDLAERVLLGAGVAPERIRLERFGSAPEPPPDTAPTGTTVTIRIGRKKASGEHRAGSTILQTARSLGLKPPSSCESGTCATCIARVTEGAVEMRNNEVLEPDEVADGYVLTCQSVPITPTVAVVYED